MVKSMHKRGQVSVFAIIGIVIVILVALFFFLRNEYGLFVQPTSFLRDKSQPIEDNLRSCVKDKLNSTLVNFGKQGGELTPSSSRLYESISVPYYCTNIVGKNQCLNVMPTLPGIINALNNKLQNEINNCVDKSLVTSGLGYKIVAGNVTTKVETGSSGIILRAHYDVSISKGESKQSVSDVVVNYDAPISDLYSVAVDAVNSEANAGFFEQLLYMVNKRGQYIINLDKPYPDKIYKIREKNSNFEFWFAIQGTETVN